MLARIFVLSLVGLLIGCPGSDKDSDPVDDSGGDDSGGVDGDGDGYGLAEDCNDSDASVNPGASEACDDVDNDCDGEIDEDISQTWYLDGDADGFGDDSYTTTSCDGEAPAGYAAQGGDCDDAEATTNPAGAEECDGADNDCDGEADEDLGGSTWYQDTDGDGYGSDTENVESCAQPDGYVAAGGDCDDGDADYHPGATEDDCTDPADYNCDGSTGYADEDGDGAAACEECDDSDPSVFPGATDTCDEIDNDCDGTVDEDATSSSYYLDSDGDGFGDPDSLLETCTPPTGYVTDNTDCDDGNPAANPDEDEICDGVDNDCNGVEDDDTAIDASTWYSDADEDGYGESGVTMVSCTQPEGYAAASGDCDDTDAAYNPGATEDDCEDPNDYNCDGSTGYADEDGDGYAACEECDDDDADVNPDATETCDGADNDCDGDTDEAGATGASAWYADADADGYGDAEETVDACDAPTGYVANDEDCDDADDSTNPEAREACDGADNDCNGDVDDGAYDASAWYADADEDGYGDDDDTTDACDAPTGYVADGGDCDDGDASTNPAADEVCDGEDNDCDGTEDDSAVDTSTWYADADEDGYGDETVTEESCEAPSGYVSLGGDCDDSDPAYNPGATEGDCDDPTDYNCDGSVGFDDDDSDGYSACDDCDDTNADINPDATETCDGVDNDCDSDVDEADAVDVSVWYMDADEDGYGDASSTDEACEAPTGYVDDDSDCDDGDANVNPGADELCDSADVDEDCDGDSDDDDPSVSGQGSWYADADEDGYGDAADVVMACDAPAGAVSDDSDCDDTDPAISPDAAEVCDSDDIDEDCDGDSDDDDSSATGQSTWYTDADGDGHGDASSTVMACDAGTGLSELDDDCDDGDETTYPGAAEVCRDEVVNDCDATVADATAECVINGAVEVDVADARRFGESSSNALGTAIGAAGDVDGDGYPDLLAAGPDIASKGRVYLFDGTITGDAGAGTYAARIGGESAGDDFGVAVAGADIDGDGYSDLFLGAQDDDDGGAGAGAAYLVPGPVSGDTSSVATLYSAKFTGEATYDMTAADLATGGDVDGDGAPDLFIGSENNDDGGKGAGAVYLMYGGASSTALASADVTLDGDAAGDGAGGEIELGDLDGDGMADLVIGASKADPVGSSSGTVYVFYGAPSTGTVLDADWTLEGAASGDLLGTSLAIGDSDGDGANELLVGAPNVDGSVTNGGGAWLYTGGGTGTETVSSGALAVLTSSRASGYLGTTVELVDLDGDGAAEILFGSPSVKFSSIAYGGVFLFYGGSTGTLASASADASMQGENDGDQAAYSLANAGDANDDGYGDLILGAPGRDRGSNTDGGALYLFLGSNY